VHRSVKEKAKRAKEAYEKGTLEKIFKIEKVERPKFEAWKDEVMT